MARIRRREKNGPGLLFILVTLVVVAVVGARFFGFYPETTERGGETPPSQVQEERADPPPPLDAEPKVLIFHSHATENYKPNDSHRRGGDPGDIIQVGTEFVAALEKHGIRSIHDTTVHDKPRYSEAFINSAKLVENVLVQQPQVQMVLDLHRDGLQDKPDGYTTTRVGDVDVAKILFVVGDKDNAKVEENMAFAQRISDALEAKYPGVTRGVRLFKSDYSGELHPNSVMVIIGDWNGNTVEQAIASAGLLAEVVASLVE